MMEDVVDVRVAQVGARRGTLDVQNLDKKFHVLVNVQSYAKEFDVFFAVGAHKDPLRASCLKMKSL